MFWAIPAAGAGYSPLPEDNLHAQAQPQPHTCDIEVGFAVSSALSVFSHIIQCREQRLVRNTVADTMGNSDTERDNDRDDWGADNTQKGLDGAQNLKAINSSQRKPGPAGTSAWPADGSALEANAFLQSFFTLYGTERQRPFETQAWTG